MTSTLILLIPLLPLLGALCCGFFALKPVKSSVAHVGAIISTLLLVTSFILSMVAFNHLMSAAQELPTALLQYPLGTWIDLTSFQLPVGLHFDQLSSLLCLLITGVGSCVHCYSFGYMKGDGGFARYFAFLGLFCSFMLLLVLADNLPLLFVGWEGVGLCSYFLISFWFQEEKNIKAANLAFWANRVGDAAFLLGMFILLKEVGTLQIPELLKLLSSLSLEGSAASGALALACLCLFIGATGKSAQLPLYLWLPEAMAGPTPVSALIHAATMVTAGVYLLVRLAPLFSLAPEVLAVVLVVALLSSLMAATMALVQRDIKKVLAYSTMSQLGLMFVACSIGAHSAAIFHLLTHGFFKALLFLAAGSVIHATSGEQDLWRYRGLKTALPWTKPLLLIGCMALAGLAPLAGFFSKDEILFHSTLFPTYGLWVYILVQGVSVLTAFYSARLYALTFNFNSAPAPQDQHHHIHESGPSMLIPMALLAFGAIFGGLLGLPHYLGLESGPFIQQWLAPLLVNHHGSTQGFLAEGVVALLSFGLGLCAFILGWIHFSKQQQHVGFQLLRPLYQCWEAGYGIEALYRSYCYRPLLWLAKIMATTVDSALSQGLNHQGQTWLQFSFQWYRRLQSGSVHHYSAWMVLGLGLFLCWHYLSS